MKMESKILKSYTEPTTIYIVGDGQINSIIDFEITDDYSNYDIYVGKTKIGSFQSDGFVGILTESEFNKWLKETDTSLEDMGDVGVDILKIDNFIGDIKLSVLLDGTTFTSDFDETEYIQHQFNLQSCEVCLIFPEGTNIENLIDSYIEEDVNYEEEEQLEGFDKTIRDLKEVICDKNIAEPITKLFYSDIEKNFFSREYTSLAEIRLNRIFEYLTDKRMLYQQYIGAMSKEYDINVSDDYDDIEALKIVSLIKDLNRFFVKESDNVVSYIPTEEEKNTNLSKLLFELEAEETNKKVKTEVDKALLSEYDKADIKGKIRIRYDYIKSKVSSDDILDTYIDSLYNPETTKLDDKNLLVNLNLIHEMLKYGLEWNFIQDEKRLKVSDTEIKLSNEWWDTILNSDEHIDVKHSRIVEKDLISTFYSAWFGDVLKKANKLSVSDSKLKVMNLLGEHISYANLLVDTIIEKTETGSIVFVTPDIVEHLGIDIIEDLNFVDKSSIIKYIGKLRDRDVFMLNIKNIKGMAKYKNELFVLNKGNKWLIDPEKPIVYFHYLENPFLERGVLKWYALADFDTDMAKSNRIIYDSKLID